MDATLDITAPDFCNDPYPFYEELRKKGDIHFAPNQNLYLVISYDEVQRILVDHELFSSKVNESFDPILLGADPPKHTENRKIVKGKEGPFNRFRLEEWIPKIEQHCARIFSSLSLEQPLDIVHGFAAKVSSSVILEMMGISQNGDSRMIKWADIAVSNESIFNPEFAESHWEQIKPLIESLLDESRTHTSYSLLRELHQRSKATGKGLSLNEIVALAKSLLVGGHETTPDLIGNVIYQMIQHPEIQDRVRETRKLIYPMIHETLRHSAPTQITHRITTRETVIAGHTVPANQLIGVGLGAAMRDPNRYENPSLFDLDRKKSNLVSFGAGIHFCIASHLAMLETRIAMDFLLDQLPVFRLASQDSTGAVRKQSSYLHGFERLVLQP